MKTLLALTSVALTLGAQAAEFPVETGPEFARTFPYSLIGQLVFESGNGAYSGSGTIIRPSSVLTAGHNLYDFDGGWSTDILFRRALYKNSALSQQYAKRLYVLGGYRESVTRFGTNDLRAFARDMGGLRFLNPVADGAAAGWTTNSRLLTGDAYKIALGYGGEFHTGSDLLSVVPLLPFDPVLGAFLENSSIYFEAGMSGGPVFAQDPKGNLFVSGIVVAGSTEPIAGGIRALDTAAGTFIRTFLR